MRKRREERGKTYTRQIALVADEREDFSEPGSRIDSDADAITVEGQLLCEHQFQSVQRIFF